MTFRKINQVHFVGIGGIGMSGIAELLLNLGFTVTGSDMKNSDNVQRLVNLGIDVHIQVVFRQGHDIAELGASASEYNAIGQGFFDIRP